VGIGAKPYEELKPRHGLGDQAGFDQLADSEASRRRLQSSHGNHPLTIGGRAIKPHAEKRRLRWRSLHALEGIVFGQYQSPALPCLGERSKPNGAGALQTMPCARSV